MISNIVGDDRMDNLEMKKYLAKSSSEKEIELLFRNQGHCNNIKEYNRIQELVNQDDGTKINSKLENGYIDIEYHNQVGEYKAKLLLQFFDKHREFYQYFLNRFQKVVIQNNRERIDTTEIIINNEPSSISLEDLLDQILSPTEHNYLHLFLSKLKEDKQLLSEEAAISLLKCLILEQDVKNKKVDFFKYLDLVHGKLINKKLYYQYAMVDLAFEYQCYPMLDKYMNHQEEEQIEFEIFKAIHQKYGLSLLNQSLEHQKDLFLEYQQQHEGTFLEKNLLPLNSLFQEKVSSIMVQFQNIEKHTSKQMDQNKILELTLEFLNEIDSTKILARELEKNINDGNIILWNPMDTEQRKVMKESYFKNVNLDEPACYLEYDEKGVLISSIVNVPLTYTLKDVVTIVHEFFHFHNNQASTKKAKEHILNEFSSIYFENLTLEFLKKKGYPKEELPVNFRVMDSLMNFILISPTIFYLSYYMENGKVEYSYLCKIVNKVRDECLKNCQELNLSDQETKEVLIQNGVYENIEESVIQLIYNLNNILLRWDESIYKGSSYLLGSILAKSAMENGIDVGEILNLSNRMNEIEDPCEVMEKVGIDLEKYHFQYKNQEEKMSSHFQK